MSNTSTYAAKNFEKIIRTKSYNTMEIHMCHAKSGREFLSARYDPDKVFCYDNVVDISGENIMECIIPYDPNDITYYEETNSYEFITEGVKYWFLL